MVSTNIYIGCCSSKKPYIVLINQNIVVKYVKTNKLLIIIQNKAKDNKKQLKFDERSISIIRMDYYMYTCKTYHPVNKILMISRNR